MENHWEDWDIQERELVDAHIDVWPMPDRSRFVDQDVGNMLN